MNDAYYEQIVDRKPTSKTIILRILLIALIPVIIIFGSQIFGVFALTIGVIYGLLFYFLILPRMNVEYEYDLLNHDLEISAIYSKANRKKKISLDIQKAELIAPKNSPRLNSYKPDKTLDFTANDASGKTFAIMIPVEQKLTCVLIDPDETMLKHMKSWMGMKMEV